MKTTSLRVMGALLVLSVLWGIVPSVQADDFSNNGISQAQEDNDADLNSIAEHAQQVLEDSQALTWPYGESDGPYGYGEPAAPVAVPQPQAQVARPVPEQVGGAAQAPPVGAVPTFRQQFFNGVTRTDVTYYRDPTGQLGFTSVSVSP